MSYTLSKSRLQAHAQCPRRLWLSVHRRDLASTDEMAELVARRGDAFGAAARDLFPGGILVAEKDPREAVRITAEAMAAFIDGLALPEAEKTRLKAMTPGSYTGAAANLARRI